jgi:hypothetical protein
MRYVKWIEISAASTIVLQDCLWRFPPPVRFTPYRVEISLRIILDWKLPLIEIYIEQVAFSVNLHNMQLQTNEVQSSRLPASATFHFTSRSHFNCARSGQVWCSSVDDDEVQSTMEAAIGRRAV